MRRGRRPQEGQLSPGPIPPPARPPRRQKGARRARRLDPDQRLAVSSIAISARTTSTRGPKPSTPDASSCVCKTSATPFKSPLWRHDPGFCFSLAYCLHVTLARRLHALAPGLTPRAVLEKFAAVQMIDVQLPTTDGR